LKLSVVKNWENLEKIFLCRDQVSEAGIDFFKLREKNFAEEVFSQNKKYSKKILKDLF